MDERIAFVVNPNSGKASLKLVDMMSDIGLVRASMSASNVLSLVSYWCHQGFEYIGVCGGDGTLNEAIRGIVLSGRDADSSNPITLVPVPAGTGNDFAYGVGWKKPQHVLEAFQTGNFEVRTAYVWYLNSLREHGDRLFINGLDIGFGGDIAARVQRLKKKRASTYLIEALKGLLSAKSFMTEVRDGEDREVFLGQALSVSFSNGPRIGGRFKLRPSADIFSPTLDLTVVGPASGWRRLLLALRGLIGEVKGEEITEYSWPIFRIFLPEETAAHFDGEPERLKGQCWISKKRGVRVIVPKP